ncbi:zinc finger protein zat3 [Quercus suber]|uniref:Zinc finger protein zat3 n=1 Tax=Quercus suber TaxID=58331 RepID=A0AAW0KQN0_QUESU
MLASGVERASERSIIDQAEFDGFFRESVGCRFECSSCKKVFGSHQALGGHRASHKNVKGCFAITRSCASDGDEFDNIQDQHGDNNERDIGAALEEEKMLMVLGGHKCSICLRFFQVVKLWVDIRGVTGRKEKKGLLLVVWT